MSCTDHRHAIVDMARGVEMGPGTAAAARAHVAACPPCAACLARERELSAGLHALALAARGEAPAGDLEARLMARFEAAAAEAAARSGWRRSAAGALAAAAGVAVALWLGAPAAGRPTPPTVPPPPAFAGARPSALAPPVPPDLAAVERALERSGAPVVGPGAAAPAPPVRTLEFTMLPGAAALPAFESGHIVRMELPVSALPSYGVEIVPDAAGTEVTADLLVGQDGLARGIRLVQK